MWQWSENFQHENGRIVRCSRFSSGQAAAAAWKEEWNPPHYIMLHNKGHGRRRRDDNSSSGRAGIVWLDRVGVWTLQ